jgi:hypothetical protein
MEINSQKPREWVDIVHEPNYIFTTTHMHGSKALLTYSPLPLSCFFSPCHALSTLPCPTPFCLAMPYPILFALPLAMLALPLDVP